MIRYLLTAACAALCFTSACAASPAETIPHTLAREVVNKTLELVESKGLYPREQAEYAQAKSELLAQLAGHADGVDRNLLYARIRGLLSTLDADGHSFVIAPSGPSAPPRGSGPSEVRRSLAFSLVKTSHGTVLRWLPPAIKGGGKNLFEDYLKRFSDEASMRPELASACALVVDLSAQTGGNAWPPFVAMYPLFGGANQASFVDREGKRAPFVNRANLESMHQLYAAGRANPLAPFASGPLAVVVGSRTASAGEMLLVALLGEERVRTFGSTSFGMTTANASHPLPDGSTLVLTQARYALAKGPVIRGGIAPMHPLAVGDGSDTSVQQAAEWVAANSASCSGKPPAAAAAQ